MNPRFACGLMLACMVLITSGGGCGRVPQVAQNPAVYKELDALYTAMTTRKPDLLQASAQRLKQLQQNGDLSEEGLTRLDGMVSQAEAGDWQQATQQLYDFMRAQRK